ncbi:MAG: hypothetical protein WC530_09475 [Candidatus Omnitrophota bacterium]|jgi:hypothetical protein
MNTNPYKIIGGKNGVMKITDRPGNYCYVDEDMTAWWRTGDVLDLSDAQVCFEGDLAEFQRLAKKYLCEKIGKPQNAKGKTPEVE